MEGATLRRLLERWWYAWIWPRPMHRKLQVRPDGIDDL
jgi:hypothetical protein